MPVFSIPAGIVFRASELVVVSEKKQVILPYASIRFPVVSGKKQEHHTSLEDVSLQTPLETLTPIVSHALTYLDPKPTLLRRPLLFVSVGVDDRGASLPLERLAYQTGCSAILPVAAGFLAGLGMGADLRSSKPTWLLLTSGSESEFCLLQHGVEQEGWKIPTSTSQVTKRFVAMVQERFLTWVEPSEAMTRVLHWAAGDKQDGVTLGGFKQGEARRKRIILTKEDLTTFWEHEKTLLVHALEQIFATLDPVLRSDLYAQGIVVAGEDQALFDLLIPTLIHQFEMPVCFLPGTEQCVVDGLQKILSYSNFFQEESQKERGNIRGYGSL